jgi:hypothetical protein
MQLKRLLHIGITYKPAKQRVRGRPRMQWKENLEARTVIILLHFTTPLCGLHTLMENRHLSFIFQKVPSHLLSSLPFFVSL